MEEEKRLRYGGVFTWQKVAAAWPLFLFTMKRLLRHRSGRLKGFDL
jgi:hypothetical protein